MVERAQTEWGRIDILVNNAGILRDKTFAKMEMSEFERVVSVHLTGSANCTKAVWNGMRDRGYGRIVFTSSSSGLYGNFGQANYGAAKAAMIGLMNVLHLEGANTISASTRCPDRRDGDDGGPAAARRRGAADAGVGDARRAVPRRRRRTLPHYPRRRRRRFRVTYIEETLGVYLDEAERSPEAIAARWHEISDRETALPLNDAFAQTWKFASLAGRAKGKS